MPTTNMRNSISIMCLLLASALVLSSCEKILNPDEPANTFTCVVNDQVQLVGDDDWYDKMKFSMHDVRTFSAHIPELYAKMMDGSSVTVGESSPVDMPGRYSLDNLKLKVGLLSGYFPKRMSSKKYLVSDRKNVKIEVFLSGGKKFSYTTQVVGGYVRFDKFDRRYDDSQPRLKAVFDLNLMVRVHSTETGKLIEEFPLHLSQGKMSYMRMREK